MANPSFTRGRWAGGACAGLTLLEVVFAAAIAAAAAMMLYPSFRLANAMIVANQQRLEADALAMDATLEIFNTANFNGILLATNLPPAAPPAGSLLPANTEIRTLITPNTGTAVPYKWDVEVRVIRDRFWPGGIRTVLTNDIVYRVTRYDIGRN